jgi:hypothetical protein
MSAGGSAWTEATRQLALADAHALEAESSRAKAANYFAAADSEKRIAHVLAPLAAAGYHFLPDRQWPGSRRAQEAALRVNPVVGYTAVIADEAQDLSCAMIRMLASVVGEGADAFTLIGDGQQTIYPGGYTLAEAGLSVHGRGVTHVVGDASYVDIEGASATATAITSPRHGDRPLFAKARTRTEHDGKLVQQIRRVTQSVSVGWGDVGVLCFTTWQVRDAVILLRTAGIPVVELTDYDGSQTDAVKVGTIKRAKGLEFKQVLLPWVAERLMSPGDIGTDRTDSEIERDERDRRELFVGVTRARDGVWVGCIVAQGPSA